jgi:hypothetical protein
MMSPITCVRVMAGTAPMAAAADLALFDSRHRDAGAGDGG